MTSFKLFGAALLLSAFVAAPASAWEAVQEPGAYSFYHPNADTLNAGPSPSSASAMASPLPREAVADTQMSVRTHRASPSAKRY
jgi:hypothetical protein